MNEIWQRERARRESIWQLDALQPGDRKAMPILQQLALLNQLDQVQPLFGVYVNAI